jgi:hypothetical protein
MPKRKNRQLRLREQIKADANPENLVAAIKRRDRSYLRGALQWYERQTGRRELIEFLRECYSDG